MSRAHGFVALPEIWAEHGRNRSDHPAVICAAGCTSWGDLVATMERVAAGLGAAGAMRGDAIAYLVPSGIDALALTMGIVRAGMVAVPLSPLLTVPQIGAQLRDANARLFLAEGPCASLEPILPERCDRTTFDALAAGGPTFASPRYAPADPAVLLYSSGTTGEPKGIVHSLDSRAHMATGLALAFRFAPESIAFVATPIFSNATWMMLTPALLLGATIVWEPEFNPTTWASRLAASRATHSFVVPVMLQAVLGGTPVAAAELRALVCAGSTLAIDLKRAAIARFGPVLFELYGNTEGLGTILPPGVSDDRLTTVGQAIAGSVVRILRDNDTLADVDEPGEIIGRGPGLMLGYHGRPEATAEAFWTDDAGDAWLRTGDIGRIDAEGWLTLVDRKKDMIVSGGLNVYPADIEAVLATRDDVAEAAVIGVPDPRWGETPVAIVRGAGMLDAAELVAWANTRVARHQRLSRAIVVDAPLPRNALGKVLKPELRALHGALP